MVKPQRVTSTDRKRVILAAAGQLFADRGYVATSMKDIGAAVGTSDAALYRHFRSKREILEALYEASGFVHEIEVFERSPGEAGIQEQFEADILLSADMWGENADFLKLVFTQALRQELQALEVHKSLVNRWRRGAERLYLVYASRGEVEPQNAYIFSRLLVDLLFGAFMARLAGTPSGGGEEAFAAPEFRERLREMLAMLIRAARYPDGDADRGSQPGTPGGKFTPPAISSERPEGV